MILFYLDPQGGFTCGDTETGRTAYAYPTSPHADRAKRPELRARTAATMVKRENDMGSAWRERIPGVTERDKQRMAVLLGGAQDYTGEMT